MVRPSPRRVEGAARLALLCLCLAAFPTASLHATTPVVQLSRTHPAALHRATRGLGAPGVRWGPSPQQANPQTLLTIQLAPLSSTPPPGAPLSPLLGASLSFLASFLLVRWWLSRGHPPGSGWQRGPEQHVQWSVCSSGGKKKNPNPKQPPKGTMPIKPPPVGPNEPRKFGKRRTARLMRHYQKWTTKIKTSLRDTMNALELFARDGETDRYVQMRYHFQLVFEQMYLKARVNGCLPSGPIPQRRTIFGRLFSLCFYQLDEAGKPTSPYKEPPSSPDTSDSEDKLDLKDIMKLTKVQRGQERQRRLERVKARKRLTLQQRKWLVMQKLRPPLPQYKEWLQKLKYQLRQIPRVVEAFIRVNRTINYRLMRDTLWQISDTMDLMWPVGLYWHSLVPRHRFAPRGPMHNVTGPHCGWCILPDKPLPDCKDEEPPYPVALSICKRMHRKLKRKKQRARPALLDDPVMPKIDSGQFNSSWEDDPGDEAGGWV